MLALGTNTYIVRFVDALPRNQAGKVVKRELAGDDGDQPDGGGDQPDDGGDQPDDGGDRQQ